MNVLLVLYLTNVCINIGVWDSLSRGRGRSRADPISYHALKTSVTIDEPN